jgi:esterase/lipase superfamily enzyme
MIAPQNIVFATNRKQTGTAGGLPTFGDVPVAPSQGSLVFGTATIDHINPADPDPARVAAIGNLTHGAFGAADLGPILASSNDVLVFIHGSANDFHDALKRAAYNRYWLSQCQLPVGHSSTFDVITFTWPGANYTFWNIVGDVIDYRHDQRSARRSANHIAMFFAQLYALKAQLGPRRLMLLCHSMGADAFAGGVERWFANPALPKTLLFDEVVLAAADETAKTFGKPNGGRLSTLYKLGREITVYFNNDDLLMDLSKLANGDFPLGDHGPPNRADTTFFPPKIYEFVNCTGVSDSMGGGFDISHQYYRQSPTVRLDLAKTLAGLVAPRPKYDPQKNYYKLF